MGREGNKNTGNWPIAFYHRGVGRNHIQWIVAETKYEAVGISLDSWWLPF